jgi:hypothetical protein
MLKNRKAAEAAELLCEFVVVAAGGEVVVDADDCWPILEEDEGEAGKGCAN